MLRGAGSYVDDIRLDNMAYGVLVRSPHGHAKINSIDVGAAKCAPGVLTVVTGDDWSAAGLGDLPSHSNGNLKRPSGAPLFVPRYPVLASDRVRWVGDPVVFIVAETLMQAVDAQELVSVEYQELDAVVSTSQALNSNGPRVYDDCDSNICFIERAGNKAAVDDALTNAQHIVRHRFVINRVTAAPMEPRGVVAYYESSNGRFIVHTATQRPHVYRAQLAQILRVAEDQVRIITGDTGGSFGLKSPVFNEVPLACYASKVVNRPIKWISTRTEGFLSDAQGRDNIVDAELALDADGKFLAMRVSLTAAIGAYLQYNMPVFFPNVGTLAGVYRTPALYVEATGVFSNTNPVRPYRGNGRPESAFIIERMIELAACEIGIDSMELRRRNYIAPSQMPFKTGLTFTYDCGEFERNMDLASTVADLNGFPQRRAESRKYGKLRGLGLSNTIERASGVGIETAELRLDVDGHFTLFVGANSQGQGHETVFKQIVADRLSVDEQLIEYVQGDTGRVRRGEGTGGSRSATMAGSACLLAVEQLIDKAKAVAAHILQVHFESIQFAGGLFSSTSSNRTLTLAEIAAAVDHPELLPPGIEKNLATSITYQSATANYPNGCHICEVEIDIETGVSQIVRYSVVDDVGTVLNPLLLHGQIHGGVAQGAGQALMENIHFDDGGQLMTASFMDYAMPRAHNLCAINVQSNPVPTKTNPLGTKGAGEAGCVGALPAVINAIGDALSEFGVADIPMPATPERLWRIINDAKLNARTTQA